MTAQQAMQSGQKALSSSLHPGSGRCFGKLAAMRGARHAWLSG